MIRIHTKLALFEISDLNTLYLYVYILKKCINAKNIVTEQRFASGFEPDPDHVIHMVLKNCPRLYPLSDPLLKLLKIQLI
jgi:hypothetical protein